MQTKTVMVFLQWKVAEVCQKLEHTLDILGISAIEDRLQVLTLPSISLS
jgi:phospholipid-translocating ATPase